MVQEIETSIPKGHLHTYIFTLLITNAIDSHVNAATLITRVYPGAR